MNVSFKNQLRIALESKNIRPIELSKLSGINKSSISNYLAGSYNPNAKHLNMISSVLNVSEAWLMGYEAPEVKLNKRIYYVKLKVNDSIMENTIQALSKHEAIGKVLEIIPTASYKNIIEVKEDT